LWLEVQQATKGTMATYGASSSNQTPEPQKSKPNWVLIGIGVFTGLGVLGSLIPESEKEVTLSRPASERCNSDSKECKEWTKLAIGCEQNMKRRDGGYMGKLPPYCTSMENLRERVTGIESSTAPGAYNF
jgi:hypothetical protein